ncbi:hypothetical protein PAHAL_1G085200 [Panicum hallii]|uniref:Uncharacterized protein n=1 Tax=Panicum hallii TaxID=206008 RepID=A0A2S3GME8_9POAL|nr:hypothetical protein PAHAL_1G085200 [Panicum hallii]
MAAARLRVRSQAVLVPSLLLLLALAFLHGAAGDELQTREGMKPFSGGKGRDEGHCLPPAKLARPLRILAETGPAMTYAWSGDHEVPVSPGHG